ncbi:MAG: methyltransferase domain-containing protein [Actinobacteria bacterium]|nr:methyltransferase domain-containing protein [Actinomycetota bacterium]MBV9936211.1 methyltransferase domain-containing protein [Actinomycetota bacterium]
MPERLRPPAPLRAWRSLARRGLRETLQRAAWNLSALVELPYRRIRPAPKFVVDGVEHTTLVRFYNTTWRNERAVEIPLALHFLSAHPGSLLEVGNVLPFYGRAGHTVVDKYEVSPGVLNVDVVEYEPPERFDAIVCISTLEHVGWDEVPRDPPKFLRALTHLRTLLAPGGRMLVTCPLAYNEFLDAGIADGRFAPAHESFLLRTGRRWHQTDSANARASGRYLGETWGGTAIWVAEFTAP